MNDQSKVNYSVVLFIAAIFFGACAAAFWLYVGEAWEQLCDGTHYMNLYNGRLAATPFGYRILTPYLARFLPWGAKTSFAAVTLICLVSVTGVIALYAHRERVGLSLAAVACAFWVTSFPFIYYGTTLVRADGPMLFLVAVVFLLSHWRISALTLFLLIVLGTLAHETMLICIPALWIDKLLSGNLTGGANYKLTDLFLISLASLFFVVVLRLFVPVLPGGMSYMSDFLGVISFTINYAGGWMKFVLRIYASYGPALLFSAFFMAPWRSARRAIGFFGLLILTVMAAFLATDTLRVMAIIYFPVILYAAKYVNELWQCGNRKAAIICLSLQALYSLTVYGHLRSFESSLMLNTIAAVLSLAALAVCLFVAYRHAVPSCDRLTLV